MIKDIVLNTNDRNLLTSLLLGLLDLRELVERFL